MPKIINSTAAQTLFVTRHPKLCNIFIFGMTLYTGTRLVYREAFNCSIKAHWAGFSSMVIPGYRFLGF